MKILILISLTICSILCHSIGGVWFQEVFFIHHEQKKHGYIQCDYWIQDYVPPKTKIPFKEFYLESTGIENDSIKLYLQLEDFSVISKIASFSMHSYEVNFNLFERISLNEIKSMTTGKLYSKIDYHIEVQSPIELSDTLWINQEAIDQFEIGEDVGCRLEITTYQSNKHTLWLIDRLKKSYLEEDLSKTTKLINVLYRRKVVVVELCGC